MEWLVHWAGYIWNGFYSGLQSQQADLLPVFLVFLTVLCWTIKLFAQEKNVGVTAIFFLFIPLIKAIHKPSFLVPVSLEYALFFLLLP